MCLLLNNNNSYFIAEVLKKCYKNRIVPSKKFYEEFKCTKTDKTAESSLKNIASPEVYQVNMQEVVLVPQYSCNPHQSP